MTSTLRLCWARSSGDAAPCPGSSSSLCPYPSWSTASPPTTRIGVTKPKKEQKREQFTIKMHHPGCGEMRWTWGRERGRGSRPRSWGKCRKCFCSRRCPPLVSVTCDMCCPQEADPSLCTLYKCTQNQFTIHTVCRQDGGGAAWPVRGQG